MAFFAHRNRKCRRSAARAICRIAVAVLHAAALGIVAGCAANATQRAPDGPPPASSRVHVVPFESPPLVVPASGGGLFIISAGQPAFGVFNLLQLAAGMPDAVERSARATRALDAELRGASGWEPTRVIAEHVRARLEPGGATVTIDAALRPVPGVGTAEVDMLSNRWIRAVRAWREDNTPVADYARLAADGVPTQVVEVAIRHYELTTGQLFLGIDMRVVDARTGRVVGRAFDYSSSSLEPVKDTFAEGGQRYKGLFAAQAGQLSDRCLAEMGLVR
ncbi:MAG: hypothetical protein OEU94_01755 [Aquincola sp.]|nr:hypothetical protein [Aquincola sp.]